MGKGFLSLKRKIYLNILIKSLLCGLAVGVSLFAVLLHLDRQMIRQTEFWITVLYAVGATALVTGLLFLILRPTKRRMAKRLDKRLQLNEKVQTMVAFEKETDPMYCLQREHTDSILAATPFKRLKMLRGVWISSVATVLSVALLVTVFLIPQKQAAEPVTPEGPPPVEETPFEVSQWQLIRLQNLIKEVEDSRMTEGSKTLVVILLQELLEELPHVETVSQMKRAVVTAIVEIRKVVKAAASYSAIGDTFKRGEASQIIRLGDTILLPDRKDLRDQIKEIRDEVKGLSRGSLSELSRELSWLLGRTSVSSKDPLLTAFADLSTALGQAAETTEDGAAPALIDSAFEAFFLSVNGILANQVADRTVGEYVVTELMDIFGLVKEDVPKSEGDSSDSSGDEDDKKNENVVGDGGIGTGDMLFGSNDTIYDPENNVHVEYGDVIFDYYPLILDALRNGELSPEWKQYIGDYFAALLGSANAGSNENQETENNED